MRIVENCGTSVPAISITPINMRFATKDGFFELNTFPGCNQIVMLNHVCIYPEKRNQGLGAKQCRFYIDKAKELGYDILICTVITSNIPQLKLMAKFGFLELDTFYNRETGNTVKIFRKRLSIDS